MNKFLFLFIYSLTVYTFKIYAPSIIYYLQSCCGKLNLMKNYGDKGKPYGRECYEKIMKDFRSSLNSSSSHDDGKLKKNDNYNTVILIKTCSYQL